MDLPVCGELRKRGITVQVQHNAEQSFLHHCVGAKVGGIRKNFYQNFRNVGNSFDCPRNGVGARGVKRKTMRGATLRR
jgi:hypothetical protein